VCLLAWGTAVFPGTLSGPIMRGFLPAELRPMAGFSDWLRILALPWMIVTVVYAGLALLVARPRQPIGVIRDAFVQGYRKLGPLTKDELATLFTTEGLHHIPIAATACGAMLLLVLAGIIRGSEIGTAVNWDVAVFFGVAMSLPGIFHVSGIGDWLSPIIGRPILGLAAFPFGFMLAATLGPLLVRFVDVPWGYTACALTVSLLVPPVESG
jgi:L-tartrate/succinate antiporter